MTPFNLDDAACARSDDLDRILRLGTAFRASMVLAAALELQVFRALADGALDGATLSQRCEIAPRGARDFFDCLAALGLLARSAGAYMLTDASRQYLEPRSPDFVGDEIVAAKARSYAAWFDLGAALRTGLPQRAGAADVYGSLSKDAPLRRVFLRGMTAGSIPAARGMAETLAWTGTILDVGAAQGAVLVEIARRHPQVTCLGLDRPENRPEFEAYVRAHDLAHRIHFHAADFLRDGFPAADNVLLGRVLHNWDLETKRALLRKARAALPTGGRLVVFERMIDDARREPAGLLASLNMLVVTPGGFDFSPSDCIGWFGETGFTHARTLPLPGAMTMVVGQAC